MSDCIVITTKVFSSLKAKKGKGVIMKLNFAKAIDTVDWDLVLQTLRRMNFGDHWIMWVKSLFDTSRISVLVNSAPMNEFRPRRGLRQSDPLSPLIFNLVGEVGEVLSKILSEASRRKLFLGIKLPSCDIEFIHLQYEDDVILFIDNDESSIRGVKRVLQYFELLFGLHINFSKSNL